MRVRLVVTAMAVLVALVAFGTPVAQADSLLYYLEVADAGNLANPQLITGGPYDGIKGNIGAPDTVDVFGFFWAGGDFQVTASYPAGPDPLILTLFDAQKNPEGVAAVTILTYTGLEGGNYFLKIATTTSVDPPFTIDLTGPSIDFSFRAYVPSVPGPPTIALVLLGAGLVGLSARRTRQRN